MIITKKGLVEIMERFSDAGNYKYLGQRVLLEKDFEKVAQTIRDIQRQKEDK